ncbi:MAG: DUF502 domain-containing protein [Deltaproteobacteria bacterium]|nr:DUF502 domain-containing protein [Deltaproteobacteria bacterium]MBI3077007.1 DUF502 domain-containing protein [Deltaproteobacteria bacterium]
MSARRRIWTFVRLRFATGLLVVIPLAVLGFLVSLGLELDAVLREEALRLTGSSMPGLGLALGLLLIFAVGVVTTNVVGRRGVALTSALLARIPLVRSIYAGTREFAEGLLAWPRGQFRRVVLVEYPRPGLFAIGFVTHEEPDGGATVFIPNTPKTVFGKTFLLQGHQLIPVAISIEDAIKMVVSGGLISPVRLVATRR